MVHRPLERAFGDQFRNSLLGIVAAIHREPARTLTRAQASRGKVGQGFTDGFDDVSLKFFRKLFNESDLGVLQRVSVIKRAAQHRSAMSVRSAQQDLMWLELELLL